MLGKGAGGILSYFTRHRTAANLLMVLMVLAGAVAIPNIRAQYFPDVVIDTMSVSVTWQGAGAEDVDRAIVQVLDPALLAVEGVTGSSARSTEGRATISVDFEPNHDMDQAEKDLKAALDSVAGSLPTSAEDPALRRGGWSDRVTDVVISGPVSVAQLGRIADETVGNLFAAGVTRTNILGFAAPSTIVEVASLDLIRNTVALSDIAGAIAAEADANPAGDVTGSARVRTGVEKRSAEAIAGIVLRTNPDGSKLTIGDVAAIRTEGPDRDRALFVGDNPAIRIQVTRTAAGDAIGLQNAVQRVADQQRASLPSGVRIDLVNSRAEEITGRLNILLTNGAQGLLLVLVILFLFLNARTALWVALGIPVSMGAAIAMMYWGGLTLNMMSLFALIITLGIIVDDAIVVGEHADHLARRRGLDGVTASETAAKRMFLPVFSATITTNIAFFGLILISGRFGDLISDIPFTVVAVLSASLFECFVILPNHLSHSIGQHLRDHWYDLPSRLMNRGFDWLRDRVMRPLMGLVIRARYAVIAGALVLLSSQVSLLVTGDVQWRFFSSPEQGEVTGNFAMLPGATRDDTLAMMHDLQRATEALGAEYEAEFGTNPLAYVVAEIGGNAGRGLSGTESKESYQLGSIAISLIDPDLRPYSSADFVTRLQETVQTSPMTETLSFRSWGAGPGGNSLEVQVFGADAPTLKAASEALKTELAQFPEVSGLEDTLSYDKEELILDLTAQGQALGFTIDGLGNSLRDSLNGIEAATYPDGARSATIRVQLPAGEMTADFLDRTQMRSPSGVYVPLADIVSVQSQTGFSAVRRENGVMQIAVTGDLDDQDAARAAEIQKTMTETILPAIENRFGVGTALGGLRQQEAAFLADAQTGLIFILSGIYLTLAWIFASWTRPLVVMSIIPFGLVGTIYGHSVWGIPMSMFTVVGLLGMIGIVINDSIVLVTTIDEYAADRGLFPAIIDGVADRLRAVFLTTITTVLGLAPLLYERSSQALFLKPTVITLVYGLGFGMLLVLLVVPAMMAIQFDVSQLVRAARRGLRSPARAIRVPVLLGAGAMLALFAGTVFPVIVTGAAWPVLARLGMADNIGAAFGVFVLALGVVLTVIYGATAVTLALRHRRGAGA